MSSITAFSNQKGGSGKTSVCLNLAYCLSKRGKRVLAVDLDPLGGLTTGCGIDKGTLSATSYNVLLSGRVYEDSIVCVSKDFYVIPANLDLAGAEVEIAHERGREKLLKKALERVEGFDYIFIDCPPSISLITVNALVAADGVIIPLTSEFCSFEGAVSLIKTANVVKGTFNGGLEIFGAVVNNYEGRSLLSRQIFDEIKDCFGEKLFKTVIPKSVRIAEAVSHGKPVCLHDGRCNGATAFEALTDEFISRNL